MKLLSLTLTFLLQFGFLGHTWAQFGGTNAPDIYSIAAETINQSAEEILNFVDANQDVLEGGLDWKTSLENLSTEFRLESDLRLREEIVLDMKTELLSVNEYEAALSALNASQGALESAHSSLSAAWATIADITTGPNYEQVRARYNEANRAYQRLILPLTQENALTQTTDLVRNAEETLLRQTLQTPFERNEDLLFPTWPNGQEEGSRTGITGVAGTNDDGFLIFTLFPTIGRILLQLGAPLILVGLLYTGYRMITSGGNDDELGKAKEYFIYLVVGAILMTVSYSIVRILYSFLAG